MVPCACWDQGIHEGRLDSFNEGCWGLFSSVILDVEDFGKVSATGLDVADLHQPVLDPADGGGVSKDSLKETIWAVGSIQLLSNIQCFRFGNLSFLSIWNISYNPRAPSFNVVDCGVVTDSR